MSSAQMKRDAGSVSNLNDFINNFMSNVLKAKMEMFHDEQLADYGNCFFQSLTLEDVESQYTVQR
jgi:hypothetical protein